MAKVSLAVTPLLCFLIFTGVRAAPPDREERQNSLDSQIRLSNGCSGILEVLTSLGRYGTATDRNFGANEARVACRQLGCLRGNIQPVRTNTGVGVNNIYQGFAYVCNGNEPNLASCKRPGAVVSPDYGIALTCSAVSIFGFSGYILSLFSAIIAAYFCL